MTKSPQSIQPLVPDATPTTGFRKWVATILTTTQVAQNVILLALLFIYRLKQTNPTVKGKPGSEYRLLTVALMLGNKFLDDNTYTNKTWAEVSGISVQEVHVMEVEFLSNMRYSLYTSKEQWEKWHTTLGKFGTYFHRASKIAVSGNKSPTGPPTPSLGVSPNYVPSPPTALQTSPRISTVYSPNPFAFANTPSLPQQATSAAVSPIGHVPELGPIVQRKRSTDHSDEPPMKRQAHGFAPGPYSNAPLIPTLQTPVNRSFEPSPSANRLPPLPSLAIPPPQHLRLPTPRTGRNFLYLFPAAAPWPWSTLRLFNGNSLPVRRLLRPRPPSPLCRRRLLIDLARLVRISLRLILRLLALLSQRQTLGNCHHLTFSTNDNHRTVRFAASIRY